MTGTNSATGVFNLSITLPTNALMGLHSEIEFKFDLSAENINFSDGYNYTCDRSCPWGCICGIFCGCCGCDNSCACDSTISETGVS
jgi:hypothetical protein